jgi:hypothetical protein
LVGAAQAFADFGQVGDEIDEFLIELGAAIDDVGDAAGLLLLLPEVVDDADDEEQRGGADQQDVALVGFAPQSPLPAWRAGRPARWG